MPPEDRRHSPIHVPYAAYNSPPCYAHEVDPAYLGLAPAIAPEALRALKSTLDTAIATLRSIRFS